MRQSTIRKLDRIYFFLLPIIIVGLFFVLQPKIAAVLISPIRVYRLSQFLIQVKKKQSLDAQVFWQFREFYAPGSFSYDHHAAELSSGLILKNNLVCQAKTPILTFASPFLLSQDSLIAQELKSTYFNTTQISPSEIIFQNQTTLIYRDNPRAVHIIFVKPITDMMKANGFFSYTDQEKKLLKNQLWLDETTIF